jgi:hypothetical protein
MKKVFFVGLIALIVTLLLFSGCVSEANGPDETGNTAPEDSNPTEENEEEEAIEKLQSILDRFANVWKISGNDMKTEIIGVEKKEENLEIQVRYTSASEEDLALNDIVIFVYDIEGEKFTEVVPVGTGSVVGKTTFEVFVNSLEMIEKIVGLR